MEHRSMWRTAIECRSTWSPINANNTSKRQHWFNFYRTKILFGKTSLRFLDCAKKSLESEKI